MALLDLYRVVCKATMDGVYGLLTHFLFAIPSPYSVRILKRIFETWQPTTAAATKIYNNKKNQLIITRCFLQQTCREPVNGVSPPAPNYQQCNVVIPCCNSTWKYFLCSLPPSPEAKNEEGGTTRSRLFRASHDRGASPTPDLLYALGHANSITVPKSTIISERNLEKNIMMEVGGGEMNK